MKQDKRFLGLAAAAGAATAAAVTMTAMSCATKTTPNSHIVECMNCSPKTTEYEIHRGRFCFGGHVKIQGVNFRSGNLYLTPAEAKREFKLAYFDVTVEGRDADKAVTHRKHYTRLGIGDTFVLEHKKWHGVQTYHITVKSYFIGYNINKLLVSACCLYRLKY